MAIQNRSLVKGTKLVAKHKKQPYECEVLDNGEGRLIYRLGDGREFKSLSAAGMAITGIACNGWVFWTEANFTGTKAVKEKAEPKAKKQETKPEDEGLTVTRLDKAAPAEKTPAPAKDGPKCDIKRVANQNGSPTGQTRWRCYTCSKSFYAPAGETPTTHS